MHGTYVCVCAHACIHSVCNEMKPEHVLCLVHACPLCTTNCVFFYFLVFGGKDSKQLCPPGDIHMYYTSSVFDWDIVY